MRTEKEARNYIIQAWAEAMELYRSGQHELKLSKDTENYLRQMQKEFMPEDCESRNLSSCGWMNCHRIMYAAP